MDISQETEIIKDFITKKYSNKDNFLKTVKKEMNLALSEKENYVTLIGEIVKEIGQGEFFKFLGVNDVREATMRSNLAATLYKGLIEASWNSQLTPLFKAVMKKEVEIKNRLSKKVAAYELAFEGQEEDFRNKWAELYRSEVLPPAIQSNGITVGPLGWIPTKTKRYFEEIVSDILTLFYGRFNDESIQTFEEVVLSLLYAMNEKPEAFDLERSDVKHIKKLLDDIIETEDKAISYAKRVQMIMSFFSDDQIVDLVNGLIAGEVKDGDGSIIKISPPSLITDVVRWPYSFSPLVLTKFGFIMQDKYNRQPVKKFHNLLVENVKNGIIPEETIPAEISVFGNDISDGLLAYCNMKSPTEILRTLFGLPQLRKIASDFGLPEAKNHGNLEEIINIITIALGFNVSPSLSGLGGYIDSIDRWIKKIEIEEEIPEIIRKAYIETEAILKNLTYYYLVYLYVDSPRRVGNDPYLLDETIRNYTGLNYGKPFNKWTLGQHINAIRRLNSLVKKEQRVKDKAKKILGVTSNAIIPKKAMELLDKASPLLTVDMRHYGGGTKSKEEYRNCLEFLKEMAQILREQKVYPLIIKLETFVVDVFGKRYFEATDDNGTKWRVPEDQANIGYVEADAPYFMMCKSKKVAIRPVLIKKIH